MAPLRRYESGTLDVPFVVVLLGRLRDQDPVVTPALAWLNRRLAEQGTTTEEILELEYSRQTAMNTTVRNVITSMRSDLGVRLGGFLRERQPGRGDARGASEGYREMDFRTRDLYRHAVEELARDADLPEPEVARGQAVQRRRPTVASDPGPHRPAGGSEPGYYLIASGRPAFERELGCRLPPGRRRRAARSSPGRRRATWAPSPSPPRSSWPCPSGSVRGRSGTSGPRRPRLCWRWSRPPSWRSSAQRLGDAAGGAAGAAPAGAARRHADGAADAGRRADPADGHGGDRGADRPAGGALPGQSGSRAALRPPLRLGGRARGDDAGRRGAARRRRGRHRAPERRSTAPLPPAMPASCSSTAGGCGAPANSAGWAGSASAASSRSSTACCAAHRTPSFLPHRDRPRRPPPGVRLRPHPGRRHPAAARGRPAADRHPGAPAEPAASTTRRSAAWWRATASSSRGSLPTLPDSHDGSLFQRIFSGPAGIDPYAAAVSDVYQDLFGEGSYTGKGIYDVDAFTAALDGKVPESRMLSHDLFEGIFARAGLVTDIELFEEFPARTSRPPPPASTAGRGATGSCCPGFSAAAGGLAAETVRAQIPVIGRYKMLDNLRRTLVAPTTFLTLARRLDAAWRVSRDLDAVRAGDDGPAGDFSGSFPDCGHGAAAFPSAAISAALRPTSSLGVARWASRSPSSPNTPGSWPMRSCAPSPGSTRRAGGCWNG